MDDCKRRWDQAIAQKLPNPRNAWVSVIHKIKHFSNNRIGNPSAIPDNSKRNIKLSPGHNALWHKKRVEKQKKR